MIQQFEFQKKGKWYYPIGDHAGKLIRLFKKESFRADDLLHMIDLGFKTTITEEVGDDTLSGTDNKT